MRQAISDEQLLSASARDAESFGRFYDRNVRLVLAVVGAQVQPATAFDITAEVFAKALEAVERFEDRGAGSARAWLLTIARNQMTDQNRRSAGERRAVERLGIEVAVMDDEQIARVELEMDVGRSELLAQLAALPAGERDAVTGHVLHEQGYNELAARSGVTEAVMRKRVSRGLARLRATTTEERT